MKPNKNIVYCTDCNRRKMLFETEKKADNFMKFNNDEIEEETGYFHRYKSRPHHPSKKV